jgi:hypothetical protein
MLKTGVADSAVHTVPGAPTWVGNDGINASGEQRNITVSDSHDGPLCFVADRTDSKS